MAGGLVAFAAVLVVGVGVPAAFALVYGHRCCTAPPPEPLLGGDQRVSAARWWALASFSTMSAVQNAVWISFSVVVPSACDFFDVHTASINFLASLGPLVLIPVAFITGPLSRSLGLRPVVVIGCALTAAGALLRVPAIFAEDGRYAWAVAGHAINAAAGPVIMSCPPLLSSTWFPLRERTTATAIAYNAQIFGIAFVSAAVPFASSIEASKTRLHRAGRRAPTSSRRDRRSRG